MKCVRPGEVTQEELLAYATGDSDSRTAAHIEACSACAAEASSYSATDLALRRGLFRIDCPETQLLGELVLGVLDPEEALRLRSHLALCHHCSAERDLLQRELQGDPLAELTTPRSAIQRVVARLLPSPDLLAYSPVRGAAGSAASTYEAAGVTISLTAQGHGMEAEGTWTLLGLVAEEAGENPRAGSPIRLLREGQVISELALDQWGHVAFENLAPGTYSLELDLADRVIVAEDITLGLAGAE